MIRHQWKMKQQKNRKIFHCERCHSMDFTGKAPNTRCGRVNLTKEVYEHIGIGKMYWTAEIEDFKSVTFYNQILKYCTNIHSFKRQGIGLFLWGNNGLGKSHLASIVLKEAVRCGYSGLFTTQHQFLSSHFDKSLELKDRCALVDFLVLDDMGKEYSTSKGWAELNFENLIRTRAKELRPIVITTNYNPKEFGEKYGPSVRSLSMEILHSINVKGQDWRVKANKRIKAMME